VIPVGKGPKIPDPYRERLDVRSANLSPASRRVASYIDSNRVAVLASSAMELAARTETSDATVIRTVQALGFAGLAELKQVLLASVDLTSTPADDMRRTLGDVGKDTDRAIDAVIEAHDEAMASLRSPEARTRIAAAVSVLHPAARIAIFGIGPSASLTVYVATLLARGGRRTLTLNATGAMLADQMLDLGSGDALLVLAYGRAYGEVVTVFAEARQLGLPIVLVTDSLDAKLARFATVILPARRGRSERVALHGATLVCLEALVLGLAAASPGTVTSFERLNRLRRDVRRNADRSDG
jgi:DNA-binding MurR/RpiR family transcriptional regulator